MTVKQKRNTASVPTDTRKQKLFPAIPSRVREIVTSTLWLRRPSEGGGGGGLKTRKIAGNLFQLHKVKLKRFLPFRCCCWHSVRNSGNGSRRKRNRALQGYENCPAESSPSAL